MIAICVAIAGQSHTELWFLCGGYHLAADDGCCGMNGPGFWWVGTQWNWVLIRNRSSVITIESMSSGAFWPEFCHDLHCCRHSARDWICRPKTNQWVIVQTDTNRTHERMGLRRRFWEQMIWKIVSWQRRMYPTPKISAVEILSCFHLPWRPIIGTREAPERGQSEATTSSDTSPP